MSGKVKSLHGVYKALGRDAFLAAARIYSDHVQKTVEATLSEMESRWFDTGHTITQADKMVRDFQNGYLTRESAEELLVQEKLQRQFAENMNAVLKNVHFVRLESSCASPNKSYAGEVLKQKHNAFMKTYGTDYLDGSSYEFVSIPSVIRSCQTGKLCLGIVTLDLQSSGEHWGTDFLTPYGVAAQGDPNMDASLQAYIRDNFMPYDYWYTADVENDIHIDLDEMPESVADLIAVARGEQQNEEFDYVMKL